MNSTYCSTGLYDDKGSFTALVVINTTLSAVSCVFIAGMIAIIVLFKKYNFFSQRLILYVAITSFSYSFFNSINVFSLEAFNNEQARYLCIALGFAAQMTYWWVFMSVTCIMIDIFIKVVIKKATEKLEIGYIVAIIFFPSSFSWVPFLYSAYGPAGTYCWIRDKNYDVNCTEFPIGVYLRFSVYYVPFYLMLVIMTVLLAVTLCVNHQRRKQWTHQSNQQIVAAQKIVAKEVRSLFVYPLILILINTLPFVYRLYDVYASTTESQDYLYFILALSTIFLFGVQGVIITIVFTFDPETRKKLNAVEIRAALKRWCGKERNAVSLYRVGSGKTDSFVEDSEESSSPYQRLSEDT